MDQHPWLEEFYPIAAKKLVESLHGETDPLIRDQKMLEHSIRKWEGLSPENLKKHRVRMLRSGSVELDPKYKENAKYLDELDENGCAPDVLGIDSDSCALCQAYLVPVVIGKPKFPGSDACHQCPLYRVRNEVRCDELLFDAEVQSPWHAFSSPWHAFSGAHDVEPMLKWLNKALEMVNSQIRTRDAEKGDVSK